MAGASWVAGTHRSGWHCFARHAQKNMQIPPTANPLTWDARQLSFSLVQPLYRGAWLETEWERNRERPDTGGRVRNDLFFVDLFTGF